MNLILLGREIVLKLGGDFHDAIPRYCSVLIMATAFEKGKENFPLPGIGIGIRPGYIWYMRVRERMPENSGKCRKMECEEG